MKKLDSCPEADGCLEEVETDMIGNSRLKVGTEIREQCLESIHSKQVRIPDPTRLVHLQFRRFAGCPICDLHLHSFAMRHSELAASIREVIVFHSTAGELWPYCDALPFETIADPDKRLYAAFGVESGLRALVRPRVWIPILRGVTRSLGKTLRGRAPLPTITPRGGRLGLPADFLIAPSGTILSCKYGSHAFDQWSVDEVLGLAGASQS